MITVPPLTEDEKATAHEAGITWREGNPRADHATALQVAKEYSGRPIESRKHIVGDHDSEIAMIFLAAAGITFGQDTGPGHKPDHLSQGEV